MLHRRLAFYLAASLAATPLAHAGDAVVADEFEQRQNVESCDAYGTGFAKLPGTDTCVKVSGKIRYEKSVSNGSGSSD